MRNKTEKKIQEIISPLLPRVAAGTDPVSLVTVRDAPEYQISHETEPMVSNQALTWLAESWQTLALVFLGLVALLVARSAAKSAGNGTPVDFQEGLGWKCPAWYRPEEEEDEEDAERMTITGGSLKEELLHLVEDNPEVAANVIRGWVGDAA